MESCQFVARRSPRGRLGSVLDVGSHLRRMHGCFQQWVHISTGPQQRAALVCRYTLARLALLCINMGAWNRIISHLGTWGYFGWMEEVLLLLLLEVLEAVRLTQRARGELRIRRARYQPELRGAPRAAAVRRGALGVVPAGRMRGISFETTTPPHAIDATLSL